MIPAHTEKNRFWRISLEVLAFWTAIMVIPTYAFWGQGCSWFKSQTKTIDQVVQCFVAPLVNEVTNLIPKVVQILEGNAVDWEQQLANLESNGVDAVVCAVVAVLDSGEMDAGLAPTGAGVVLSPGAKARAYTYLSHKELKHYDMRRK